MPASAAGTAAAATIHTCGSSSKPVMRKAITRSEMLVEVVRPSVRGTASL